MPAYTEQQRAYWLSAFACGPPAGPPPALAEFTLTVGATAKWYSRHSGETIGALASGSLALGTAGTISRVWKVDSDSFRFNSIGGDFAGWAAANQTVEIVITTPYGVGTLLVANDQGNGMSWMNLAVTAPQFAIFDQVLFMDTVTIRIGLP